MAELRWTFEAVRWLEEIHDYIAEEDPRAAKRVVSGIYQKAQLLKTFPLLGYKHRIENEGEIRILLYGHYRIAYLILDGQDIDILGVFHGAMEIENYLRR